MFKVDKIMIAALMTSSEALAHSGHNAPALHWHEWDYALLTGAVVAAALVMRKIKAKAKK